MQRALPEAAEARSPKEEDAWRRLEGIREVARRAGVAPVRPRLLRQIIRADRDIIGFGDPPHPDAFVMGKEPLARLVAQEGYLLETKALPDPALLIAEPSFDELQRRSDDALKKRVLALAYHVKVDARLALEAREGRLSEERADELIERLGREDVREAVWILDLEDRLLPPRSPRADLMELIATYLELKAFAPEAVPVYFPSLERARLDEVIEGLSVPLGLEEVLGPERAAEAEGYRRAVSAAAVADAFEDDDEEGGETDAGETGEHLATGASATFAAAPIPPEVNKLLLKAEKARADGNLVGAIVLRNRARPDRPRRERRALLLENETDLERLGARLAGVLEGGPDERRWAQVLRPLARDSGRGFWSRRTKLLYDLQKVCLDAERPGVQLDVPGYVRSRGKKPISILLHDQVPVRVHRHLRSALLRALTLPGAEVRRPLAEALRQAEGAVRRQIRDRFRGRLGRTLSRVGFEPKNLPEDVAQAKIVEGLLDRICDRDYIAFGDLRDQLSQNNLKMQDMRSVTRLVFGDALLRADQLLARSLRGVYRKSPIYMRMLQRVSSLAFGNGLGRALTRFAILPFLSAFVALEGLQHLVGPLMGLFGAHAHPKLATWPAVLGLGAFILTLIESRRLRDVCVRGLKAVGRGLRRALWTLPLKLVKQPWVRRVLDSYAMALLRRFILKPLVPAALCIIILPRWGLDPAQVGSAFLGSFLVMSAFLNSRFGKIVEARVGDALALWWGRVRYRLLPNLFHFVMETSRRVLRFVERLNYTVDELLRFRKGDRRIAFLVKLGGGSVWSAVMYVVQLYMNLLVEPQINPIKHFPVVTVSHKVILPATPEIFRLMNAPIEPILGAWVSGTIVGTTVFLLPGFFGFLVWELSANWKLYEASRPKTLKPVRIGSHGETMVGMLRPGFHSGTLPKAYQKLRRRALAIAFGERGGTIARQSEDLHHAEEAIHRFVEREMLAVLERLPGHERGLHVGHVHLSASQVRFDLSGEADGKDPLKVVLIERDGTLLARLAPGLLDGLEAHPRQAIADALLGVLVRSQVDALDVAGAPRRPLEARVEWARWVARWEAERDPEAKPAPLWEGLATPAT